MEFILYTRGFVGARDHATESIRKGKKQILLSVFDMNPGSVKHSVVNEQIVQAYNQLVRQQVKTLDFDWRERVIKAGMAAFGTRSVKSWIAGCERSPTFTQTHADCIADWLRFARTGKRNLPVSMWERLIQAGANDPSAPSQVCREEVAALSPGYSYVLNTNTPGSDMHNLVSQALAQPGGFTDFLTTLYTFFGESTGNDQS